MNFKNLTPIVFILIVIISCEDKNWDNPYDEESSTNFDWAPFISNIEQEDESIVLEFGCNETNFDSYVIERSVDNGSFSKVTSPGKTATEWVDNNITKGGKLHKYKIYAKAGSNNSNSDEAEITPYLNPIISIELLNVSHIDAKCKVTIEKDGGNNLETVEVCWNLYGNPTIKSKNYESAAYKDNVNSYELELKDLIPDTTYYAIGVLYYANGNKYVYSSEISFQTEKMKISKGESFVDNRDGEVYPTVIINNQNWMAKNFSLKVNSGCWAYENKESLVDDYGRLYTWEKALEICPAGWHLPTTEEWEELINYVGGLDGLDRLRTKYGWWLENGTNGNNETGFSIPPGGWYMNGSFGHRYLRAFYWTATEYDSNNADYYSFINSGSYGVGNNNKSFGFSVRYVKN
jgi:uncharacterized protein (TIGR02145 family)